MAAKITRRRLLGSAGAAAVGAALGERALAYPAPAIRRSRIMPAVAASANAHPHAVDKALDLLAAGKDTLDAAVAGVNLVEDDPLDDSVGYGGLPNEEGIVELDASCMHGPSMNAGAVASLRNIKNPSSVARDVLWYTDHVLMVGEGALRFARARGYPETNLLTEASRKQWLEWKTKLSREDDWLDAGEKAPRELPASAPAAAPEKGGKRQTGTVNISICNDKGEVSGVTSTSGLAWKIPGRVGDSPIIGAGLYVDGEIGAAGSTGRGEANLIACGAHTVVEAMRAGMHPKDACLHAIKRALAVNKIKYLWKDGKPTYQLTFYAVDTKGRTGGAAIYARTYACAYDGSASKLEDAAYVYKDEPR
jgi:N4-(beta-N-acetylglucosaminyl)-L-asparaginase